MSSPLLLKPEETRQKLAVIYAANRDRIGDPDLIYAGQVFKLPSKN